MEKSECSGGWRRFMGWRFVDHPGAKSKSNMKLRMSLVTLNLFAVISSLIMMVYELVPLSVALIAVSSVLFYFNFESLSEAILLVLVYPFSWFFLIVPLKNKRLEDFFKFELPDEIRTNVEGDVLSTLPIKAILTVGSIEQKKKVARDIIRNVVSGFNVEQNMRYLRILLRDSHMDVVLQATMALEEIEDHFERRIGVCEEPTQLCRDVYLYLRTDIPRGVLRKDFEEILQRSLQHVNNRDATYYELLHYLSRDEEHLIIGYEETRDEKLLVRYLFEKLRKRDLEAVKKRLHETDRRIFEKYFIGS